MIPAARAAAAIEVLADIDARRRPAADAMKDWGLAHRFAGSGDRAAISSLVYDALRRKSSSAWIMGEATPRAEILGALRQTRGLDVEAIAALFSGEGHAPAALTDAERARLAAADLSGAPPHVAGDFPEWLAPQFEASFGDKAADEGRALAERAPVDLRVNLLKSHARQGARRAFLSRARADAVLAGRLAHRHAPRRARAAARVRPGLCQGPRRSAGRGLAARRAPGRSQAGHAGPRPLRRRRRQDARARRGDGKPGPDLRRRPGRSRGSRRSSPGSPARARATSRCGRRGAKRTCSPTSKGAAIWSSSTRPAPAPAPGGATPTPSGASAPARSSSASRTRTKRLKTRCVSSSAAGASSTSPARSSGPRTRTGSPNSWRRHDDFLPVDAGAQARSAGLPALAEHRSTFGPGFRLSPRATGTDGFYVATLARSVRGREWQATGGTRSAFSRSRSRFSRPSSTSPRPCAARFGRIRCPGSCSES